MTRHERASEACGSDSEGAGDSAVLAYAPEVDGHEDDGDERQEQHVQDVPAQQRLGADLLSAEEDEPDLLAENRGVAGMLVPTVTANSASWSHGRR